MDGGDRTDPGLLLVQKVLDRNGKKKGIFFLGGKKQPEWGLNNNVILRESE